MPGHHRDGSTDHCCRPFWLPPCLIPPHSRLCQCCKIRVRKHRTALQSSHTRRSPRRDGNLYCRDAEDVIPANVPCSPQKPPPRSAESTDPVAAMAPPKSSKAGHDDAKSESTTTKEKNGHGQGSNHSNGKLRRVASNTGTQSKDTGATAAVGTAGPVSAPENIIPSVSPRPSRAREVVALANETSPRSYNGRHSTEMRCTPTAVNTASTLRRPSHPRTTN